MTDRRTGIDLGGTKIEACVLSEAGEVVARERVATPQGDYTGTLRAIAGLIETVEGEAGGGAPGLGIGTPGSLSPASGLIRNANSTCLNGQPLDRDLAAVLGRLVRLENDANCFALAEARSGAARDAETVFGVILGTGFGGGLIVRGETLDGRNGIAGEWGHNPLPRPLPSEIPGPLCYCGRYGCIEAWCSGPALAADHLRVTGSDLSAEMISAFAASGDMEARETLNRHVDRLGRSIASVVNLFDPDVVVLGGGLSNMAHLYEELPDAMRPHIFSDVFETPIRRAELGDSAGVIGAAWLCPTGAE